MKRWFLAYWVLCIFGKELASEANSMSTSSASSDRYRCLGSPKPLVLDFNPTTASSSTSSSASSSYRMLSPSSRLPGIPESLEREDSTERTEMATPPYSTSSTSSSPSRRLCEQQFFERACHFTFDCNQECAAISALKIYTSTAQQEREYLAVAFQPYATCQGSRRVGAIFDIESNTVHAWLLGELISDSISRRCIVVSADNKTLVIATGMVLQWFDAQTGAYQGFKRIHKQIDQCVAKGSEFFTTRFSDGSAALWPFVFDSTPAYELSFSTDVVRVADVSSDGKLSAFASGGSCKLFDNHKKECLKEIGLSTQIHVTAIALESRLLGIACGQTLFLVDLAKKLPDRIDESITFDFPISKIFIDPWSRYTACALRDHSVRIIGAAEQKKIIDIGEKILDIQAGEHDLRISAEHKIYFVNVTNNFAVTKIINYGRPTQFARGKQFAAYTQAPTMTICCLSLGSDQTFDPFVRKLKQKFLRKKRRGEADMPILLSPEEQELFGKLTAFSQQSVREQFPLLVTEAAQIVFVKNLLKENAQEIRVLSRSERRLFQELSAPVRDKIQSKFPLLVSDEQQAQLVNNVLIENDPIITKKIFASLPPDVKDKICHRKTHLIISDSRVVRGFWRLIDAVGLDYFSRNTVRVAAWVLALSALGVGSWRLWAKYHKALKYCPFKG